MDIRVKNLKRLKEIMLSGDLDLAEQFFNQIHAVEKMALPKSSRAVISVIISLGIRRPIQISPEYFSARNMKEPIVNVIIRFSRAVNSGYGTIEYCNKVLDSIARGSSMVHPENGHSIKILAKGVYKKAIKQGYPVEYLMRNFTLREMKREFLSFDLSV